MDHPREYTKEEVREIFLNHVRMMVDYWDNQPNQSCKSRLDGLAFSILTDIDGFSGGCPAFILAPCPHPDDKEYNIDNGENYFPRTDEKLINCDIAGELHDNYYNYSKC